MKISRAMRVEIHRHQENRPWTYGLLDQRQQQIAQEIRDHEEPGTLLLSELAPVITKGRRTPDTDLSLSAEHLKSLGISVYPTDRGGLATYHGPGQWVLFVVDRLDRLTGDPRGVKAAVLGLLEVARLALDSIGVVTERRAGTELGLWTPKGKIAAVGIHVEDGVLMHGLSVNGYATPLSFLGVRPCGLDLPIDFAIQRAGSEVSTPLSLPQEEQFQALARGLLREARKRFDRASPAIDGPEVRSYTQPVLNHPSSLIVGS